MNALFVILYFLTNFAVAKPPENAATYVCPSAANNGSMTTPVFLTETKDHLVLGICGVKDSEINNFTNFKLQILSGSKMKKPTVFRDKSKNKKFLVLEKRDGLLLIEKIKVAENYVELFRHDIVCDEVDCKTQKEICIVQNPEKRTWIKQRIKDVKIKARMKKTGC